MKLLKIIAALLALGGIFAAIVGAGQAFEKSLTLGACIMIGGVLALMLAVGIIKCVQIEEEARNAEQEVETWNCRN